MKLLSLYIVHTMLVILDAVAYLGYHLSLAGYWTDKVLVWSWLAFTVVIITKYFKRGLAKAYLGSLVLLLVLSFIPFGLFFISFMSFITANDRSFNYEVTPQIRVQQILRSPMAAPSTEVVRKSGVFEEVLGSLPREFEVDNKYYSIEEAAAIQFMPGEDDSSIIRVQFPRGAVQQKIKWNDR